LILLLESLTEESLENTVTSTTTPSYAAEQVTAWLRGLVTVALADGDFSESEKAVIQDLVWTKLAPELANSIYEPITPTALATALNGDATLGENFLRTAVIVALADGIYSPGEAQLLEEFCQALNIRVSALDALQKTVEGKEGKGQPAPALAAGEQDVRKLLSPVKQWLDGMEVHDPRVARFLCKMIPSQCPFERDVVLFGHKVVHIPPLCKLNPLYEQLVGLRFRALSYLADDCKEDVSAYL
jgi:tellurite resistance protein